MANTRLSSHVKVNEFNNTCQNKLSRDEYESDSIMPMATLCNHSFKDCLSHPIEIGMFFVFYSYRDNFSNEFIFTKRLDSNLFTLKKQNPPV